MHSYDVAVRDDHAEWTFRCQAEGRAHAVEQALGEPTVREVLDARLTVTAGEAKHRYRDAVDALLAAEQILEHADRSWNATMGWVQELLGPVGDMRDILE